MDLIDRQDVIELVKNSYYDLAESMEDTWAMVADVEKLPSAQPERIQNNVVHLCDSCQYTYATCPSHGNDAGFGDGKGNDNICACNKYLPISAQAEQIWLPLTESDIDHLFDYYAKEKDENLTDRAQELKEAMWVGYMAAMKAQHEPHWIPCSDCERRCNKWENSKTSQE